MIWTRNGYTAPPTRLEVDSLQSALDELSEQVADLSEKNFDLQIQVNDLAGQVSTLEECLGWFEAELK
jgi:chromosome segregation ATPase